MQQGFQQQGFDVEVLPLGDEHTLMLRSDEFKDAAAREGVTEKLSEQRKALCAMGVWFLQVGYSKGTLSGDVMKTQSLACPAEKVARLQAHKQDRENFAASVQQGLGGKYQVTAEGTTLVMKSDGDFGTAANRSQFIRMFMSDAETLRKLCGINFTHLKVEGLGHSQTAALTCR